MGQMSITAGASSFIKGDKEIPTHLIQKPISKCPAPIGQPGHPGKPFPIDIDAIVKLPGGIVSKLRLHDCNHIIADTLNAVNGRFSMSETKALHNFHSDIEGMNQTELDEMKDCLVRRMGSRDSSQTERELMQKLYEITDAVSEHRVPPHLHDFFDEVRPLPMPIRPIGPCQPSPRPWLEQVKPQIKWVG